MNKLKKLFAVAILISAMLALGACGDGYKEFDLDKCEEVALQYLEERYGEKFEVTYCGEAKKFVGSAGYVKVIVKKERDEEEKIYLVIVHPKGEKDENDDGYYDSYEVTSDDYMVELIDYVIKEKMDELFVNADFPEFSSDMGIIVKNDKNGRARISSDFVEEDAYNLSLEELFKKYEILIGYDIYILNENYNNELESQMTEILKKILSHDCICCTIYTYSQENYNEGNTQNGQSGYYNVSERKNDFIVED